MINFGEGHVARVLSLIEGHRRFLVANTGDTVDPLTDFFVINNQGILANNRHFTGHTRQEYHPSGDATTEGQSILIEGMIYTYLGTGDSRYLALAEYYWDTYIQYFYRGQSIPTQPQRWICNWIVNGKEPVLAHYPLSDTNAVTQGGFKGIEFAFVNGLTQIPHNAPRWGQYLDVVSYGIPANTVLGWNSINAQALPMDSEGKADWSQEYVNRYEIAWMIAWSGEKITGAGDVIETGLPLSERGKVQLVNTSVNGPAKLSYAVKLPVEHGGTLIARNEAQHNRPLHVPIRGPVQQMGNASDAEIWMIDATYQLHQLTGKPKYANALQSILYTVNEYLDIDADDAFFRREQLGTTPFTDGISYSFTYPLDIAVQYSRDDAGFTVADMPTAGQLSLEQQSVRFRINADSILSVECAALGNAGAAVGVTLYVTISERKAGGASVRYVYRPAPSTALDIQSLSLPFSKLIRSEKPDGSAYMVGTSSDVVSINGTSYSAVYEQDVLGDRDTTVMRCTMPEGGQFIIGFWGQPGATLNPNAIVYKCTKETFIRFTDDEGWRWYWTLPASSVWRVHTLVPEDVNLSGWQPDADGRPNPTAPVYSSFAEVIVMHDETQTTDFYWYCVNDIPPLFNNNDGWTARFRITFNCQEPYTAKLGLCKVRQHRTDSLAYTPGLLPFSNNYTVGTSRFDAWRGLPYPGYQSPIAHCLGYAPDDDVKFFNVTRFLWDSQQYYFERFALMGPDAYAYIWDRPDNTQYGPADTFTMDQWVEGRAWSGYQPRGFCWAARCWQYMVEQGQPVPVKLIEYCENWLRFLVAYMDESGQTPNTIPSNAPATTAVNGGFNGHMVGLWLAGVAFCVQARSSVPGIVKLMDDIVNYISANYHVIAPGNKMNGSWSSWAGGGYFYGFWAGEMLRGLGAYLVCRKSVNLATPQVTLRGEIWGDAVVDANESAKLRVAVCGGTGTYTYNWSVPAGYTVSSNTGRVAEITRNAAEVMQSQTITVTCTVTDGISTVSLNIDMHYVVELSLSIATVEPAVCNIPNLGGQCTASSTLVATANGGTGAYTYTWSADGADVIGSGNAVAVNRTADAGSAVIAVSCTVTDINGSTATRTVDVAFEHVYTVDTQTRWVYEMDGVDDYYVLNSGIDISFVGASIRIKFILDKLNGIQRIFGTPANNNTRLAINNANRLVFRPVESDWAFGPTLQVGVLYDLTITRTPSGYTAVLNGVTYNHNWIYTEQSLITSFGVYGNVSSGGNLSGILLEIETNNYKWLLDNPSSNIQQSTPEGNPATLMNGNSARWVQYQNDTPPEPAPVYASPWAGATVSAFRLGDGQLAAAIQILSDGRVNIAPGGFFGSWVDVVTQGHEVLVTVVSKDVMVNLIYTQGWQSLSHNVYISADTEAQGFINLLADVRIQIRNAESIIVCDGVVTFNLQREY